MTKQQILQATGDDLSRMAGQIFCLIGGSCYECAHLKDRDICTASYPEVTAKGCCDWEADPIPLDWPNAMKQMELIVKECGEEAFVMAILQVYSALDIAYRKGMVFNTWLIIHIQPEHYIKAAMLCKKRSSK